MPQFVIEREIAGASRMSEAEVRDASLASLAVLKQLGPEIRWMHSFVTDDKIYCIFWAPHEELIREHGKRAGFPVDRVAAVRRILDPVNFEA
jgi:hypothetical protein